MKISFLYFEETDYCYRSNKNNFKIYQVNSQKVYHDIGTSVETTNEEELINLKTYMHGILFGQNFILLKKKKG